jgi:predicted GH43/DUF377 family glycosyl hydrolase
MIPIPLRRHEVILLPQIDRVILRSSIPPDVHSITTVIGRALALTEDEAAHELAIVREEFDERHYQIDSLLQANFDAVLPHVFTHHPVSKERQLLIGALFSGEYSLESAALFNPSIIPHPDQTNILEGNLRFIMSLRATGEGHISSIEFRTGTVAQDGSITIDPVSGFVTMPAIVPDPSYEKKSFVAKLHEMGFHDDNSTTVMSPLNDNFSRSDLERSVSAVRRASMTVSQEMKRTLECIQWLADSNYELCFPETLDLTERIIFPVSPTETNGIEDARFVRFIEDDGSVMYYATYTAYNGRVILPQLIQTKDFLHFHILTLNGGGVQNKGMALFPRRIGGLYAMLSRQDDQNLFIMFSHSPHHWNDPELILRPAQVWESVKLGNCGSPLETEAGWLVITHGVGPMRKYCIGAILLDLEDPRKVIGRLQYPLISPKEDEREGYVPNVVYSCGSLIHGEKLILPFAISDRYSVITSIRLDDLLSTLCSSSVAPDPG